MYNARHETCHIVSAQKLFGPCLIVVVELSNLECGNWTLLFSGLGKTQQGLISKSQSSRNIDSVVSVLVMDEQTKDL